MTALANDAPRRKRRRVVGWRLLSLVVVVTIIAVFLLPYLWMVSSGLKTQNSIFSDVAPFSWQAFVPVHGTFDNIARLFTEKSIGRALLNSLIVALIQVAPLCQPWMRHQDRPD